MTLADLAGIAMCAPGVWGAVAGERLEPGTFGLAYSGGPEVDAGLFAALEQRVPVWFDLRRLYLYPRGRVRHVTLTLEL